MATSETESRQTARPLSPFMIGSAYRVQMTSASSFGIRVTGIALGLTVILFAAWLFAAATSDIWFARLNWLATSWLGWLFWILSAWALWFHFLGGLRHFIFDDARMMELKTAERLGRIMFIGASILTLLTIIVAVI